MRQLKFGIEETKVGIETGGYSAFGAQFEVACRIAGDKGQRLFQRQETFFYEQSHLLQVEVQGGGAIGRFSCFGIGAAHSATAVTGEGDAVEGRVGFEGFHDAAVGSVEFGSSGGEIYHATHTGKFYGLPE